MLFRSELKAYIEYIGQIETYERKNKSSLVKQNITLKTKDGQRLFAELRSHCFEKVKYLRKGQSVKIGYNFAGSIKNNKRYNNIIINEIDAL